MIYLASTSPRRIELIKKITTDFKIISPTFDESKISKSVNHLSLLESENKAKSVQNLVNFDDCIIACDTIVKYKDRVFLKPKNLDDAFKTLEFLSNKTHEVISGYTIIYKGKVISKEVTTEVTFNKLSNDLINKYIHENNVLDKAGSYAIQFDDKYHLINKIKGSLDNVIGFPTQEIRNDLISLKII